MEPSPPPTRQGTWSFIAVRSMSAVAAVCVAVKVLGFLEKQLLAWWFGASATADAYFVTLAAVNAMFFLWKELLDPVLLPFFVSKSTSSDVQSAVGGLQLGSIAIVGLGIPATLGIVFWTTPIIHWLAPGLSTEHLQVTRSILQVGALAIPFAALSVLTQIVLNGTRHFATAAFGDVAQKAALLLSILAAKVSSNPALALGVAPVAGAAAKVLVHLPLARAWLGRCFTSWQGSPEDRRRLRQLTAPLLIAALFSQGRELVENHFASRVGVGVIAAHLYAKRLAELPLTLVAQTVTTVSFPQMSQLAAEGNAKQAIQVACSCIRGLLMAFLPLGALVYLLSEHLVTLLFARGAFDANAVATSVSALRIYGIGLPWLAIEPVVIAAFYSLSDTKTPVAAGILAAIVELVLMALFIGTLGVQAVAGAVVSAKLLKSLTLGAILWRRTPGGTIRSFTTASVRLLIPFVVCVAGALPVLDWLVGLRSLNVHASSRLRLVGEAAVLGATVSLLFAACWSVSYFTTRPEDTNPRTW